MWNRFVDPSHASGTFPSDSCPYRFPLPSDRSSRFPLFLAAAVLLIPLIPFATEDRLIVLLAVHACLCPCVAFPRQPGRFSPRSPYSPFPHRFSCRFSCRCSLTLWFAGWHRGGCCAVRACQIARAPSSSLQLDHLFASLFICSSCLFGGSRRFFVPCCLRRRRPGAPVLPLPLLYNRSPPLPPLIRLPPTSLRCAADAAPAHAGATTTWPVPPRIASSSKMPAAVAAADEEIDKLCPAVAQRQRQSRIHHSLFLQE